MNANQTRQSGTDINRRAMFAQLARDYVNFANGREELGLQNVKSLLCYAVKDWLAEHGHVSVDSRLYFNHGQMRLAEFTDPTGKGTDKALADITSVVYLEEFGLPTFTNSEWECEEYTIDCIDTAHLLRLYLVLIEIGESEMLKKS